MRRNGLLFLCVANTARSQMAEGFARFIGPSDMRYFSAGATPGTISDFTIKVMREVGIDISNQRAKPVGDISLDQVNTIISLCEEEVCPPVPSGVHHLIWPLPDPAGLSGSDDDKLQEFRRVRDQIRELVSRLF